VQESSLTCIGLLLNPFGPNGNLIAPGEAGAVDVAAGGEAEVFVLPPFPFPLPLLPRPLFLLTNPDLFLAVLLAQLLSKSMSDRTGLGRGT
jgi:hypothetical protein